MVDALDSPRCTCKPKVVVISTILRKITKRLDLSSLTDASSLLQYIVVEYVFHVNCHSCKYIDNVLLFFLFISALREFTGFIMTLVPNSYCLNTNSCKQYN